MAAIGRRSARSARRARAERREARSLPSHAALLAKPLLVSLVATSLLAAVAGGLLRAGVPLPDSALIGQAAVAHAALMMCGFFGSVIGVERAVAIKRGPAFAAPLLSGLAGVLMLGGALQAAAWLWAVAAVAFVAVNVVVVRLQLAAHTLLLLVGALAWLVGNLLFAFGAGGHAVLPWWFAFLVLTIAAERLEMTRLMRRHPLAEGSLHTILFALLLSAGLSAVQQVVGGIAYGAALLALAGWLVLFDIARRTALAHGLSRYMAVCLLTGYLWLGAGGIAWGLMAIGAPTRDLALHAIGLGFVFSMVMGHAPVILPAVLRVKLLFGAWFYAPLALLHASLLLRVAGGLADPALRSTGSLLNALAMALFILTVVGSALAWRRRESALNLPRS
jgi:hypothetical protein